MVPATTFAGRRVAVFGLGRSGNATCRSLIAGGAEVAAWDDKPASREQAALLAIPIVDLAEADWAAFDSLVLAPGVPLTHPEPHWTVAAAQAAGVEVIGDVEIFFRERARHAPDAPFVAITGTNGKSTTTALIGHVLRSADTGLTVEVGGNIGTPILSLAPPDLSHIHVVELSSYQIDLTPSLKPSVGILLNVTPDHIDRHGTFANYAAVKERLIAASEYPVVSIDDDVVRAIATRHGTPLRPVTTLSTAKGSRADLILDGTTIRIAGTAETVDLAGIVSLRCGWWYHRE